MFIIKELDYILEAIDGHNMDMLAAKAKQLKETDGEGWAIGEMIERAVKKLAEDRMTFSLALDDVKNGYCIYRDGWNGKNMHVSMIHLYTADNIQIDNNA